MVVCVEERAVANECWHFKSLMHNLKSTILINRHYGHFLVISCQYFLIVLKELDELVRINTIYSHLTDRQGLFFSPLLKHNKLLLFIFVYDGNLSLKFEQVLCFIKELLLYLHSAFLPPLHYYFWYT